MFSSKLHNIFKVLIKSLAVTVIAIAGFYGMERVCHLATDGFAITRICTPLPENNAFASPSIELSLVKDVLSQKFTYLSCGGQSYVFISEDKNYVLKFFKFHHMRVPPWIHYVPLFGRLKQYRDFKICKKQKVIEETFTSYVIAYDLFKDKTGVLYHHLNPTKNLNQSITITDKIGYSFTLNADELAFVIQKTGQLAYKTIATLVENKDISSAKQRIRELLELSVERCKRGIGDEDPDFKTNLGFIDGSAAQLDMGRFYHNKAGASPDSYPDEIFRITRDFRDWLLTIHPELAAFLDHEICKLKHSESYE